MEHIIVSQVDDVHLKVECSDAINHELYDFFSFESPTAKFQKNNKKYKGWDGLIRLYSKRTGKLYVGLYEELIRYCKEEEYDVVDNCNFKSKNVSYDGIDDFIEEHIAPTDEDGDRITPYKHQICATQVAINKGRSLLLSPTSSGKSLIAYCMVRFWERYKDLHEKRILIIVPTKSLVEQMYEDFSDYSQKNSWDRDSKCQRIHGEHDWGCIDRKIVISTWQSIYEQPKEWFDQFGAVIVDEVHLAKAKSIKGIMENLTSCKYRIGMTGTLDNFECNRYILTGLFGAPVIIERTKSLMSQGLVANLKVKVLALQYFDDLKKQVNKLKYQQEIDFINQFKPRNIFIKNLALAQKKNTLILAERIDAHLIPLYEMIKENTDRPVYLVYGGVDVEDREKIRQLAEKSENCIICASFGTFSTGVNIKNLHNLIMASSTKSIVRLLQSIGRILRKSKFGNEVTVFDLCDDFSYRGKPNYVLDHARERAKIYIGEEFDVDYIKPRKKLAA